MQDGYDVGLKATCWHTGGTQMAGQSLRWTVKLIGPSYASHRQALQLFFPYTDSADIMVLRIMACSVAASL
jgi:hypothetical protein